MSRGTTLFELLLGVVLIGIVSAVGLPRLPAMLDRQAVNHAVQQIVTGHRAARAVAFQEARVAVLLIRPESVAVAVVLQGDTAIRWSTAGPAANNVTLTGPTHPVVVTPAGIGLGFSNGTYHLVRGAARADVVFSRLGRIRVVRP